MRIFTRLTCLLCLLFVGLSLFAQSENNRRIKIKQIHTDGSTTIVEELISDDTSWQDYFEKVDRDNLKRIEIQITEGEGSNADSDVQVIINQPARVEMGGRDYKFDYNYNYSNNSSHGEHTRRPIIGFYESHDDVEEGISVGNLVGRAKAGAAGLTSGDVILTVDGQPTNNTHDLRSILRDHEIGDVVPVVVSRNGQEQTLQIELSGESYSYGGSWQRDPCAVFIGVQTTELHGSDSGVRISGIIDDTPAASTELQPGDIILALDDVAVNDFRELRTERDKHEPGDYFTLSILREGKSLEIDAQFKNCEKPDAAEEPEEEEEEEENQTPEPIPAPDLDLPGLPVQNFQLFPNPSFGEVQLQFEAEQLPTIIQVIDLNGRTLFEEQINNFSGTYSDNLDLESFPPGTYFLQVRQRDQVRTERLIIQPRA